LSGSLFAVNIGLTDDRAPLSRGVWGGESMWCSVPALLAVFGAIQSANTLMQRFCRASPQPSLVAQTFDPQKLASSVYRSGRAQTSGTVLDVADGKTATISVEKDGDRLLIKTNGKTDATANVNPAGHFAADEPTMALIGALPLLIHDAPRRVANIGFGSGLTSKMILADPRVLHLDTYRNRTEDGGACQAFRSAEPQRLLPIRAALFASRMPNRSSPPTGRRTTSSFPNPPTHGSAASPASFRWSSTGTFRGILNKDGLFAQWLQIYETHPDRVMSC
jgi:hypothetical protein